MENTEKRTGPAVNHPEDYNRVSLKRPVIRRLGTIMCDMVETTPIVFNGRLYRFESVRAARCNEANTYGDSYFRFVDVRTDEGTEPFAWRHDFGAAYTEGKYMYVSGIVPKSDRKTPDEGATVRVFRSSDLKEWEIIGELQLPDGTNGYNTGICKKDGVYTMLIETNKPIHFRFRFAQSTDLMHWELLPDEYRFHESNRYAGGPAIYTLPGDPHYYVFYLESYHSTYFANCVARSLDLKHWTYSPLNPVLMFDEAEDRKIGNPFLSLHEQDRIARGIDINNSDLELCEFNGRTIMYYSWGCQCGVEFLAEAAYEGSMADFIHSYFYEKDEDNEFFD